MNTMSEKVKKIMAAVIDVSITKEQAMEVLRVKYDWLYPYITNGVWDDHYGLYLKSKGALLETKCGCVIKRDSKEHDECRCDDDGENWICAGCYCGEYDADDSDDDDEEKIGNCSDCPGYFEAGKDNCKTCDFDLNAYNKSAEEYCCCCRNPDEGLDGGCKCDCHTEIDTDEDEERDCICAGCDNDIKEDGFCSEGCRYGEIAGFWTCKKCSNKCENVEVCPNCDDNDCICVIDENENVIANKNCKEHNCCKVCSKCVECKFNDVAWLCADCQKNIDESDDESDESDETAEFLKQLARKVNVSPDDEYIKSAIKYITNST